mgnify:FL=1
MASPFIPTSFDAISGGKNSFTRRWGSANAAHAVDPYISGYFGIKFQYLPDENIKAMINASGHDSSKFEGRAIKNILESTCTNVTIPGGTLNKTEFNGLGNVTYSVPTNATFDNTLSLRFTEFSGIPLFTIFHNWVRLIRDYRTGISNLPSQQYTKANYAATMFYWTVKPNGIDVEQAYCFTGLFPMKDPADLFSHELGAIDKIEIDIDFNVDYAWHEPWVYDRCTKFAQDTFGSGKTYIENDVWAADTN